MTWNTRARIHLTATQEIASACISFHLCLSLQPSGQVLHPNWGVLIRLRAIRLTQHSYLCQEQLRSAGLTAGPVLDMMWQCSCHLKTNTNIQMDHKPTLFYECACSHTNWDCEEHGMTQMCETLLPAVSSGVYYISMTAVCQKADTKTLFLETLCVRVIKCLSVCPSVFWFGKHYQGELKESKQECCSFTKNKH